MNALGRELCFGDHALPFETTITVAHVKNAVEILIQRCDVHFDQLADKLTEPRVARIIERVLIGEEVLGDDVQVSNEDQQYLLDLGLLRMGESSLEVANPIYCEVIPRELTVARQRVLGQNPAWYVKSDGRLDIEKVLKVYIEFYKKHSELITKRKTYTEAAHHLLFMAWLQRIVNGGGSISREYAAGLGRHDLLIEFGPDSFAFELKLSGSQTFEEGRVQLAAYLDRLSLKFGRLIIFSRHAVEDWSTVGRRQQISENGKEIEVIYL